ncbi:MAG: hypothetical protein ABL921_22385 [Pirellula sp.]
MIERRIVIIPFLAGKRDSQGEHVEPNIHKILEKWFDRHPEFRILEGSFKLIQAKSHLDDGTPTILVRVTAEECQALAEYDHCQDIDLYREYLLDDPDQPQQRMEKIWVDQCEATRDIEFEFGVEKAIAYLVGEKFLRYIEAAETNREFRNELSLFADEIKSIFEQWQLKDFFDSPLRFGALGYATDEATYEALRAPMDKSELIREDTRNLLLLEAARELLLEE